MNAITDAYKKVPMMFQAQTKGRCQLNYIADLRKENRVKQDVEIWTEEWIEKSEEKVPEFPETVATKTYKFSWRFVTNGGQDDGIIRPVMGARGVPCYPGSSMKGAFRQACRTLAPDKMDKYCGDTDNPGILRFHGGYPIDDSWQNDLVDLVHPQQGWQVKTPTTNARPNSETPKALVSLYQPELKFGISSNQTLGDNEWNTIWDIWQHAVSSGLGCRVSAGYGQPKQQTGKILYRAYLEGQGMAATVIGGKSEFRPNIFKASIRGHALRIFGGLTNNRTAERLVENLFGGVSESGTYGLLAMNWEDTVEPIPGKSDKGYGEPTYKVEGVLNWRLTQTVSREKQIAVTNLIEALLRFAMLLGGFGKSWRRADHRLFYEDYYRIRKPLIGCHWRWCDESLSKSNLISGCERVASFLDSVVRTAKTWMNVEGYSPTPGNYTNWREAWHQDKVQVWGRIAEDREDSRAITWFHEAYQREIREIRQPKRSIYKTSLTGRVEKENKTQIGRIWHRMYPLAIKNSKSKQPKYKYTSNPRYLELLTIFPDGSDLCEDFLDFLYSERSGFMWLW